MARYLRSARGKSWHKENPDEPEWSWCGLRTNWAETEVRDETPISSGQPRGDLCPRCARAEARRQEPHLRKRTAYGLNWSSNA